MASELNFARLICIYIIMSYLLRLLILPSLILKIKINISIDRLIVYFQMILRR